VHAGDDLAHCRARVHALSPGATLDRGYAVVQRPDGTIVRSPHGVSRGDALDIRLAEGGLGATVTGRRGVDLSQAPPP
ncbi:MAG: exodeoxyribonuclease VII large subunit, partial [Carbonactinosporaceae bacterium]